MNIDEKIEELVAKLFCTYAGIEPVDPIDGSPNWWMFSNEAKKSLSEVRSRVGKMSAPRIE